MEFDKNEKKKLIEYVSVRLSKETDLPLIEARNIVKKSILIKKFETSPTFVAHCSVGQLVELVKNDRELVKL